MINVIEIEKFLTHKECDRIIELATSIGLENATTVYKTDNFSQSIVSESFNKRKICYIENENLKKIKDITEKIILKINELKYVNNITYSDILTYSFNKYTESDFLNLHSDEHEIANGATITIVMELSDNFEGGEFCYWSDNTEHKFKKGKGTMYIFPSSTKHRVTKLTNGIRYSFNAWPRMKKNKALI
jgi:predicted 2-oxoglutarate/Fe(II)-dependent dioxygenase YbiX